MTNPSRWVFCPMAGRPGHRTTLMERFRRWRRRALAPEQPVFLMSSYAAPIYPERYRGKRE